MYAIIATGGKQYKVSEGDIIKVEKIDAEAGNTVNSIEKLTSEECSYKINDRRATIDFQMDTVGDGSQLLLQSLKMGLEGIADGYPGNVTINIEEV